MHCLGNGHPCARLNKHLMQLGWAISNVWFNISRGLNMSKCQLIDRCNFITASGQKENFRFHIIRGWFTSLALPLKKNSKDSYLQLFWVKAKSSDYIFIRYVKFLAQSCHQAKIHEWQLGIIFNRSTSVMYQNEIPKKKGNWMHTFNYLILQLIQLIWDLESRILVLHLSLGWKRMTSCPYFSNHNLFDPIVIVMLVLQAENKRPLGSIFPTTILSNY